MTKIRISKKNFYIYLQKHYAGKYVAYSEKSEEILAVGKSFTELEKKLEKKKANFEEVVFSGPIQKPNRIYVYFFPLQAKDN